MTDYIGRFAPSPSGPLHFGSLIAALASYLDARAHNGRWLLRIEDLDPPREVPGSAQQIISSLSEHGLEWDGPICWQSHREQAYQEADKALQRAGLCYRCDCSRNQLAASNGRYQGYCRERNLAPDSDAATRIKVGDASVAFQDIVQGPQHQNLAETVGDFIIRRKDGLYAYQLAVVVDDAASSVNHVIRGADLLDSSPRQIHLQQCLGLPTPVYGHLPLAINQQGQKLSKQNLAEALDSARVIENLEAALRFLGQAATPRRYRRPADLLNWAREHWRRQGIPRQLNIPGQTAWTDML